MLTTVIIINSLIALLCLYIARQIWNLRRILANVADTLTSVERSTYNVLHPAPQAIIKGQTGTRQLRKQYQQLQTQLQQAQKILSLISFSQNLWQRSNRSKRTTKKR